MKRVQQCSYSELSIPLLKNGPSVARFEIMYRFKMDSSLTLPLTSVFFSSFQLFPLLLVDSHGAWHVAVIIVYYNPMLLGS